MTLHAHAAGTVTIDWTAIAANTRLLADRARGELMAVVKADGFGHGSVEVATAALANGATWLGVTCLPEALPLREAGLTAPILSWLDGAGADFSAAVNHDIELAVPRHQLLPHERAGRTAGRTPQAASHVTNGRQIAEQRTRHNPQHYRRSSGTRSGRCRSRRRPGA